MSVNSTFVDTNLMEKGIAALVRSGSYPSREAILQESFTLFLRTYPEHRLLMAIELYQAALVPLNQAAALAGLPPFDFKVVLQARGNSNIPKPLTLGQKRQLVDQLCGSWANDSSLTAIFVEIEQKRHLPALREVSFDATS